MQYNNATTLKDRGGFFQGLLDELSGLYQSGDLGVNKTTAKNLSNYSTQKIPDLIASQVQGITAPYRKGLLNTPQAFLDMLNEGARTLGADIKDYEPMAQKGRESLESEYANRGLTRSSLRGKAVEDLYTDIGKKQKQMVLQDYLTDTGYAEQDYAAMQELYEQTEGKQKPQQTQYEPYKVAQPTTSAGRYGTSYLNWLNEALR